MRGLKESDEPKNSQHASMNNPYVWGDEKPLYHMMAICLKINNQICECYMTVPVPDSPSRLNIDLELLHQIHPRRPHPGTLTIYVHRYSKEHEDQLDDSEPDEHRLRPIAF